MTLERTSAKHAKDRAHDPYECSECGYVVQVPLKEPRAPSWCPRCRKG